MKNTVEKNTMEKNTVEEKEIQFVLQWNQWQCGLSLGLGLAWQQTYWSLPDTCFEDLKQIQIQIQI